MYILVYCENTDAGDPIDSVNIRCFSKKENAQRAMEEAYQKTDAILHYSDMEEDDDNYVVRSEDSITVHSGMDSIRWEVLEAIPEDTEELHEGVFDSTGFQEEDDASARMLVLYHLGRDSWNRPVYESDGTLYVDTEPRKDRKPKIFTKCENQFDGEPDCPISEDKDIRFLPKRETWD